MLVPDEGGGVAVQDDPLQGMGDPMGAPVDLVELDHFPSLFYFHVKVQTRMDSHHLHSCPPPRKSGFVPKWLVAAGFALERHKKECGRGWGQLVKEDGVSM